MWSIPTIWKNGVSQNASTSVTTSTHGGNKREYISLRPLSRLKKVKGHASLKVGEECLLRHDNRAYRLCQLLKSEISLSGQVWTVKVGYEDGHGLTNRKYKTTPLTEIVVSVQRMARLAPSGKEGLLKAFITCNLRVPRECCPRPPSDTAKQDNDAPDALQKKGLRCAEAAMKIKET